ncbi:MAG TPA: IclR family transcriptional regulator C-terminal domain-containing protein, partial [Actinomycetospora sp.]|nr:IclR family transcriptional regulator C-terminal domain-containing protein [Actinomycetospora sp.]
HTITDPDELRRALATVRARGWSDAVDEREIGIASLAAPIRDVRGAVVAAIGIGAPVTRFKAMHRKRLARTVVEAGEAVSRRLGWSEAVVDGAGSAALRVAPPLLEKES